MVKHADHRRRIAARTNGGQGKAVIRGTRIPVEKVLAHLAEHPDALEELLAAFPKLSIDDVKACLAYAEGLVAGRRRETVRDVRPRRRRKRTREDYRAFKSAAGGWRDVDTDRLIADIYTARRASNRPQLQV